MNINLSDTAKGLIKGIIILSAIGAIIGVIICFFIEANPVFYAIGVVLGMILSIVKTVMLEMTINKVLQMEGKNQARNNMRLAYMSRLFVSAAVLFLTLYIFGLAGLAGAFVGTIALTVSAYGIKLFSKKQENI